MSDSADEAEAALRRAIGQQPVQDGRRLDDSRSFVGRVGGCGVRVQIDHIDGRLAGGITLMLHSLGVEAAEDVLRFLSQRNAPNGRPA